MAKLVQVCFVFRHAAPGAETSTTGDRSKYRINMKSMTHNSPPRWPLLMHDQARLEYARLLWKRPRARERLLSHWTDPRHPYAGRFENDFRNLIERVLLATADDDDALDLELRAEGKSLRVVVREIPPVFGSFY
jgi:hypothetical protein